MKKIYLILSLVLVALGIYFFINKKSAPVATENLSNVPASNNAQNIPVNPPSQSPAAGNQNNQNASAFQAPLDRVGERVTKKPFGIYITPQTSPVQPERFQGYHTGTDFEVFPEELSIDVPVHVVCTGQLLLKEYASGYGGVAVEACNLGSQPITVIYGHLNLASINLNKGDSLQVGDVLGNLGVGYSTQTDGERKHLHLGFHKGATISILGYVRARSDLSAWLDPCQYVCSQ
jgi:hypothetical protein